MDRNAGLSFCTIAGYGSNGAIIHYRPDKDTSAVIGQQSTFLLDSGGQYLDGTTDTTRTLHFGIPDAETKKCYTLVLKGHIALARAVFPEGTLGSRLDSLARLPLWSAGLDFNHGTGHGGDKRLSLLNSFLHILKHTFHRRRGFSECPRRPSVDQLSETGQRSRLLQWYDDVE